MKKITVVVDMQNDFVRGSLENRDAVYIIPSILEEISKSDVVIYTRDTHFDDYLETQEGKSLPVPHCINKTHGWEIADGLYRQGCMVVDKYTFGSTWLPQYLVSNYRHVMDSIELIGLCTDICVISNAMILKANFPALPIIVDSSCCAGVTPESHNNALSVMKMCQIEVI